MGQSEQEKLTQKTFLLLIHKRQTRTVRLSEAGIRHATHYDYITRSRNTEVYFAQSKQF